MGVNISFPLYSINFLRLETGCLLAPRERLPRSAGHRKTGKSLNGQTEQYRSSFGLPTSIKQKEKMLMSLKGVLRSRLET